MLYKLNLIVAFLAFIFFTSCSGNSSEKKDLDKILSDIEIETLFGLDEVNKSDWTEVYIIAPSELFDIKNSGLEMPKALEKTVSDQMVSSGTCLLLFVKNNKVVNYASVSRTVADFSRLKSADYFLSKQKYYLNRDRVVFIDLDVRYDYTIEDAAVE